MGLIRVATYNVHRCVGFDALEKPDRIAAVLREIDADAVALQEVWCRHSPPHDFARYLAQELGAEAVEGFTVSGRAGLFGNVLLTRHGVAEVRRSDISIPGREPRGILEAVLSIGGSRVALLATHLGLRSAERRAQTGRILTMLEATAAEVIVLAGDFNEWLAWGRSLRWLSKWFGTPRAPATFPATFPLLRLDRIWVRPPDRLVRLSAHRTPLSRIASDHLPAVAEIRIGD